MRSQISAAAASRETGGGSETRLPRPGRSTGTVTMLGATALRKGRKNPADPPAWWKQKTGVGWPSLRAGSGIGGAERAARMSWLILRSLRERAGTRKAEWPHGDGWTRQTETR